jgi:hypothetical protein
MNLGKDICNRKGHHLKKDIRRLIVKTYKTIQEFKI